MTIATPEAAICESLLHEVPAVGGILPRASYETRTMTAIELVRDVNLAMLMGPGLRSLAGLLLACEGRATACLTQCLAVARTRAQFGGGADAARRRSRHHSSPMGRHTR